MGKLTRTIPTREDLLLPVGGPLRSPLRYPGGKARAAKLLYPYMPLDHKEYREPFIGGGAMFFYKPKAEKNWINDLHPGLYAFWRTVKEHFDAFAKRCREQDATDLPGTFRYWVGQTDRMPTSGEERLVERAVHYYFINRTVWTGRVVYAPTLRSRLYFSNPQGWGNIERRLEQLRACSVKLQNVDITNRSFELCLDGTTSDTFIYADPPYYRDSLDTPTSRLYEGLFAVDQHELLRDKLAACPAKVMVSYDDRPEVRALYSDHKKWRVVELQWKYCGRYAKTKKQREENHKEQKVTGRELLIMNY